jgi:alkylation response protein AidB-like acyl-CoA dehydrogenase
MNFEHTDDRRMLADSLNRFIAEQYAFDARDRIAKSAHGFSPDIWRRFAELGVIGALFGEADGGFGGAGFDIAVVFEALGRGLVVEPLLASAVLAGEAIAAAEAAVFLAHQHADGAQFGKVVPHLGRITLGRGGDLVAGLEAIALGDEAVQAVGEHAPFFGMFKVHVRCPLTAPGSSSR